MLGALAKYDPKGYKAGEIPSYGQWTSWVATDLMVYGLQKAGGNPTRASFIANLRKVSSWDDSGVIATPVRFTNFATQGMLPADSCLYYFRLEGSAFQAVDGGKKFCGKYIPTK